MNPVLRNILAVIIGLVLGSIVNMALIMISGSVIAPPAGADMTTSEGIAAAAPLLEPKHFLFPFLAHAAGTLFGSWIAFKIARAKKTCAYIVGFFFLAGGIANCFMIPAPVWFIAADLVIAYLPMSWLATRLGSSAKA